MGGLYFLLVMASLSAALIGILIKLSSVMGVSTLLGEYVESCSTIHNYKKIAKFSLTDKGKECQIGDYWSILNKKPIGYLEISFDSFRSVSDVCGNWRVLSITGRSSNNLLVTLPTEFSGNLENIEPILKNGRIDGYMIVANLDIEATNAAMATPIAAIIEAGTETALIVMKSPLDYRRFRKYIKSIIFGVAYDMLKKRIESNESISDNETLMFCKEVKRMSRIKQQQADDEFSLARKTLEEQLAQSLFGDKFSDEQRKSKLEDDSYGK